MRRVAVALGFAIAGAAGLAGSGCAGRTLPEPTSGDVASAGQRWPDVTADELRQGRGLVEVRCTACHRPVAPARFSPEAWPGLVAAMADRAELTPGEQQAIERYLITMASAGSR